MNPDRLLLGIVLPLGVANTKDREIYYAPQVRDFANMYDMQEAPAPIMIGHRWQHTMDRERIGWWLSFAIVGAFDDRPPGVLGLGELSGSPWGSGMLEQLGRKPGSFGLSPELMRGAGANEWITEVSLVSTERPEYQAPAFADARVIAVGPSSLDEWKRITGRDVPPITDWPMETVYGPSILVGKRVVRDQWQDPIWTR